MIGGYTDYSLASGSHLSRINLGFREVPQLACVYVFLNNKKPLLDRVNQYVPNLLIFLMSCIKNSVSVPIPNYFQLSLDTISKGKLVLKVILHTFYFKNESD